ncbi:DUF6542 domain-containing protein [Gordonia crocea]|uniref:DUF6542 domain-containing protein n=1 Tax=Gordonia crocea TaxID=589162 RepID=A0A7I9V0E7_9ACTN|nr:DUF6542 domain-containing protein [Gordonia crocea]GED98845.1 hypothetical protein nbrc107697_28840 [Gordonia crocea]
MRFLQAEPDLPLAEQSAAANRRGVPWWGAVLIAFGFALFGVILDSATARLFTLSEGIHARQVCFVLGCLLAALAVRNRALFTAAVQTPLIAVALVIARVIGVQLKGLLTDAHIPQLDSLLIKQVFAFSNDFPVILFTFLAVLTVVIARWWRYRQARAAATLSQQSTKTKTSADKRKTAKAAAEEVTDSATPAGPKPESAATRASRAAAAAQANPRPAPRVRPAGDPGLRASPAVVPSSRGARPPAGRPGEPAVRPRQNRMTAGAVSRERAASPQPQHQPRPASAPSQQPPQSLRRTAPPPLDDEGF